MDGKSNPRICLIMAALLVGMGLVVNTNVCKSDDIYIVVDDMEDYNDRVDIREVWRDGNADVVWGGIYPDIYLVRGGSSGSILNVSTAVGSPFNGATGPTLNDEAMVLRYDNDGFTTTGLPGEEMWIYDAPYYSEIEANTVGNNSLNVGQNWAGEGVESLSLSFQGHPVSDGDYDTSMWPAYTLYGRGRDIGGRHDEFYFFSQYPFIGDGVIQVQVSSMDNTDPWAKAGVMIREKWTPYSKYAAVFMTPNNGIRFQYRDVEGGPTTEITKPGVSAPQYVRLVRNLDDSFEAEHSANGFVWEDVNAPGNPPVSPLIEMGTPVDPNLYIGTAVTSHNANQICAAGFNDISIIPFPTSWIIGNIGTNDPEQLYVALSDGLNTAVVKHNDSYAATLTEWQEWNIPLTAFPDVDFNSIKKVYIGLGDRDTHPDAGGSGTVYIDDIRLYKFTPLFVDSGAPAGGDGSSWANAYRYLQDALVVATINNEIRVAEGTYKPDQGAGVTLGDRTATFQLINYVPIYGGYAGFGEPDPNDRDIDAYPTILSGDIGTAVVNADNSYHVVTSNGTESSAILDGFTITGGNANGSFPHDSGAGLRNNSSSPTVTNCMFSENSASNGTGGGMFNFDNSNPEVSECTFSGNEAGWGGGMCNDNSSPHVSNCSFSDNNSVGGDGGGGMMNLQSTATLVNCVFFNNSSAKVGGGMFNVASSLAMINCTFSGNSALIDGGGMYNDWDSNPTLTNCTFSDNSASNGSGGGMGNSINSDPTVRECTFSGNDANVSGGGMFNLGNSNPEVSDCTFSGNEAGWGGGMCNDNSSPYVSNCSFSDNNSVGGDGGGGMMNYISSATMANCLFLNNYAAKVGGGMFNVAGSLTMINCTFSGNSAVIDGGGMYNDWESYPTLTNCILWADEPNEIVNNHISNTTVNYSDVQGGWTGSGNIDADPCFVDADKPDPNLWNLRLKQDSPCIDAGNTTAVPTGIFSDADGNLRGVDDPASPDTGISVFSVTVDMGAYEFQLCKIRGDVNCDGVVDFKDVAILCANWLAGTEPEL